MNNKKKGTKKKNDIDYDQILTELGFDPQEFEVLDLYNKSNSIKIISFKIKIKMSMRTHLEVEESLKKMKLVEGEKKNFLMKTA